MHEPLIKSLFPERFESNNVPKDTEGERKDEPYSSQ